MIFVHFDPMVKFSTHSIDDSESEGKISSYSEPSHSETTDSPIPRTVCTRQVQIEFDSPNLLPPAKKPRVLLTPDTKISPTKDFEAKPSSSSVSSVGTSTSSSQGIFSPIWKPSHYPFIPPRPGAKCSDKICSLCQEKVDWIPVGARKDIWYPEEQECGCEFHAPCILEWLSRSDSLANDCCPECKESLLDGYLERGGKEIPDYSAFWAKEGLLALRK